MFPLKNLARKELSQLLVIFSEPDYICSHMCGSSVILMADWYIFFY